MENMDYDSLLAAYKQATEAWVAAIRTEEALATSDTSMAAMEQWDSAGLRVHDVEAEAKKARDRYKNALRLKNYGF